MIVTSYRLITLKVIGSTSMHEVTRALHGLVVYANEMQIRLDPISLIMNINTSIGFGLTPQVY